MLYVEVACVRKALLHTIALEGKEGETLLYSTVQNQEVESILHYIYMCHGQGCRYIGDKLIPPFMTESL